MDTDPTGEPTPPSEFLDGSVGATHPRLAAIEHAVDIGLLDLGNFPESFAELEEELCQYYSQTGMVSASPERASMLVARSIRNAGLTVMKALVDERLVKALNLRLQDERSLIPDYVPEKNLYTEGAGHEQRGVYDLFMRSITAYYLGATASFFCRGGEKVDALWESLSQHEVDYNRTWNRYADAAKAAGVTRLNPPFEPFGDLQDDIVGGIGNNMLTLQTELLAHQRQFDERWDPASGEPYATFMCRTALARTALLTLPACINRTAAARILPDPEVALQNNRLVCEDPLLQTAKPNGLERGAGEDERWAHPSLHEGRWRVPGHCAGDVPHISTSEGAAHVEEFFRHVSERAGKDIREPDGRIRSATIAHGVGALIAEETMYKKRVSK